CGELAVVAFFFLKKENVQPVKVVQLKSPGDHVFVVLGSPTNLADVDSWGSDVFICDPWANIACSSNQYKVQWLTKMTSWSAKGKWLWGDKTQRFIDPLGDDWKLAINNHQIEAFGLNYP